MLSDSGLYSAFPNLEKEPFGEFVPGSPERILADAFIPKEQSPAEMFAKIVDLPITLATSTLSPVTLSR